LNFFPSEAAKAYLNKEIVLASRLHWSMPDMDAMDVVEFDEVFRQVYEMIEKEQEEIDAGTSTR